MDPWRPIAPVDEPTEDHESSNRRVAPRIQAAREFVHWLGVGRMFSVLVTVPLLGVGGYLLLRTPAAPVETKIDYATTVPEPRAQRGLETETSTQIMVHVAGHVYSPGVYALDAGQRIVDAIRAAGGAEPIADLNSVNLALLVSDGDQVYVPAVGEVHHAPAVGRIGTASAGESGTFPVNINSATAADLDALPGVGPSTAAAIVSFRDQFGPFASTSDLLEVPGIGPAKFEAIKSLVTT